MDWVWMWIIRVRNFIFRRRWDRDVRQEMAFHLDMETRERLREGMDPRAARRSALITFGGTERFRQQAWEGRWGSVADVLRQDVRHAIRALIQNPGFSTAAIVTLALGIGANTAMFSVVNTVLLQPLPYTDAHEIVRIQTSWAGSPKANISPAEFLDYRERLEGFSAIGVYSFGTVNVTGDGEPLLVSAAFLTSGVLPALGATAAMGRTFTPEEDLANAPVVVISDGFWRDRFAASADVIGRTLNGNGRDYEIIGVARPDFRLPELLSSTTPVHLYVPAGITSTMAVSRGSHYLNGVARRAEGVTQARAAAAIESLAATMVRDFPDSYPADMQFTATAVPLDEDVTGDVRSLLWILFVSVGFVLLIVGANVANLLLARADGRQREFSLRLALGSSRRRIAAQLVVESVVLAMIGGLVGIVLAVVCIDILATLEATNLPRLGEIHLDRRVLGFGITVSLVVGLLFGIVPGLQVSSNRLAACLREGGRSATGTRRSQRLRAMLIAGEIALAVILLSGAGLLTRSFVELVRVDPGYRSDQVLTTRITLPTARYASDDERRGFFREFVTRLAEMPGVDAAGGVSNLPLATRLGDLNFTIEHRPVPEGAVSPRGDWQVITPGYFEAMGVTLLDGRGIEARDHAAAPGAVVVSESLARLHWPNGDALGKRFVLGGEAGPGMVTIVGIVRDVRHSGLDASPTPQMYLPHEQFTFWNGGSAVAALSIVVRSDAPTTELRTAIQGLARSMDPQLPLSSFRSMNEVRSASVAQPRLLMALLGAFSVLALILAAVGTYGVIAYMAGKRTAEFGIRLALGARPSQVLSLVLREAVRLGGTGIGIGIVATVVLTRVMEGLLYGVSARDPMTLLVAASILGATGLLAAYLPAARATRVDPVESLRAD